MIQAHAILTKYSKTRVRHFSVWIISCSVTMFACRKSRSSDTESARQVIYTPFSQLTIVWTELQQIQKRSKECRRKNVNLPSLMAVHGAPSSCSNRISFSATKFSVSRLLPLNTVAYVPCRQHINSHHSEWYVTTLQHINWHTVDSTKVGGSTHLAQFVQLGVRF